MQGFTTQEASAEATEQTAVHTKLQPTVQSGGQGDRRLPEQDRRHRADRRQTPNRVFENRARRVGLALDRRQPEGWRALLAQRCGAFLRGIRSLATNLSGSTGTGNERRGQLQPDNS